MKTVKVAALLLLAAGLCAGQTNSSFTNITVSGRPWIDVTSPLIGALCDGVDDDTGPINAAISLANAIDGNVLFPDGKVCVVATNSSPALVADRMLAIGFSCGLPTAKTRPGGGINNACQVKFTGTPAIGLGVRGSFGISIAGVTFKAANAAFSGRIISGEHFPGDTNCGGNPCDTDNLTFTNNTVDGTGSTCAVGLYLDKVITSPHIDGNHFFGCSTQLQGASGAGSYANSIGIAGNDFNGSSAVTTFIMNGGESWHFSHNTIEVNNSSAPTINNSGGFQDLSFEYEGNWDADDSGTGAMTKYNLPANTVAHFGTNTLSATRNNSTLLSAGNNSNISLEPQEYIAGSTFGTMFSLGSGVNIDIACSTYATLTTFMSGTPAHGRICDSTGQMRNLGNVSFNLPFGTASSASIHARAQLANANTLPTFTGTAILGDGACDTSGAGGAGKCAGVVGMGRAVNALAGDKAYGGFFKSNGFSSALEEVAVHAEVSDAATSSTIFECVGGGSTKCHIDGLGNFYFTNLLLSPTAPTIATHFNTSGDSVAANNGTASFVITVGSGAGTSTGALTLPTSATGWNCHLDNQTRADVIQQTGSSTTSATLTNFGTTFVATNWTNGDTLRGGCTAN